jgi:hypothetical protein
MRRPLGCYRIEMLSAANRVRRIGIIAITAILSLAATPTAQSPQDAVIVFYRVPTGQPVKPQANIIRKIFDRNTPPDPDQNPTIYQMTAGGATRLATIAKGEFFELHVRPGHYSFSWTSGPARGEQTLVSANAGEQAFVQVQFRSITQVGADAAMADLTDLRPTNEARVLNAAVRVPPDMTWRRQPIQPSDAPTDAATAQDQPPVQQAETTPSSPSQEIVERDSHTKTLGWIRQTYLNQPIIVRGSVEGGVLVDWYNARKVANRYRREPSRSVAEKYRGQTAKVAAIEWADAENPSQPQPAVLAKPFDKSVSEDAIVDPAFELVAQFADGTLAMTGTRLEFLADRARLVSEQSLREAEMARNLPLVIGKSLYATSVSTLYDPDTTIEDIKSSREILKRLSAARIPLFEPLKILAARYLSAEDAVLIRLRLPAGSEVVSFTDAQLLDAAPANGPFIEKISGNLLAVVPKDLTANEVTAIKQGELFRGMSGAAVFYLFGAADIETNWGAGGKQRIYLNQISVHFDNKNKVVDWQVLRPK